MPTKTRTGHLFKRGNRFYVSWRVNHKPFCKVLRDEQGSAITVRRDAEVAKDKFMAAFAHASEAEVLGNIAAKLEGRKAELAKLEDEKDPPLSMDKAWETYLASPNRPDSGKSTLRQYDFQFEAFAVWAQQHKPAPTFLRDVTRTMAEEYATHLIGSGLSANTYNKHLNLLTLVWRVLKSKVKLNGTVNPWEEIPRKRLTTQSRRELTLQELKSICTAANGELRVLIALGIYAGLRLGDAATLHWGEVDMDRGIIRRVPRKTARRNGKPVIVPIHPVLLQMLSQVPDRSSTSPVLPRMAALYSRRVDAVTDLVQEHFENCGIRTIKQGTGSGNGRAVVEVGFHSLRHSFVSLCRISDAPLAVVEAIVGHANPAMTRHYTHVGELAAGQAIGALPDVTKDTKLKKREPFEAILSKAKRIAGQMTSKNWRAKRDKLMLLLS